jgi:ABC-type antimicrobial peptide transport system permease subunit
VSDSYFGVLDIPLLRGQSLDGMALLAIFAVASLLLAAAGIYGIVAHSVGQRLREMGIRIALGARAADVMRHVVGGCANFAGLGVAAGLIIVAALGNVLDALTPVWAGVTPREVAASAMVVAVVALAAAYVPARRAGSADPLDTLRQH